METDFFNIKFASENMHSDDRGPPQIGLRSLFLLTVVAAITAAGARRGGINGFWLMLLFSIGVWIICSIIMAVAEKRESAVKDGKPEVPELPTDDAKRASYFDC